jgi:2-desacetyl-2-hydroxyethyl bacteriochlorophyllide A dehydrogenase
LKQAILYGARDLRLEERALHPDTLRPGEVYVETEVTALSTGTDLANYLGRSTEIPGAPDYPRAVGYSNVGVVRRASAAARRFREGQRVFALKPHQSAYIAAESELLVPVPEGVAPEEASLAYLAQLGLAALGQARHGAGETVAVVGLGVIGLCTVGVARALGAKVFAVANSAMRAAVAQRMGAEAGTAGEVDVVVLTANTWDAYRTAVEMTRPHGRISILGFPGRGQARTEFNPLDPQWFYRKSLTLVAAGQTSREGCAANLERILGWMAAGALRLQPVISHRLPAAEMREAYELAAAHDQSLTGAVFDWRGTR